MLVGSIITTVIILKYNTDVDPAPDVALFTVDGLYFLTHTRLIHRQKLHRSHPHLLLALSK